MVQLLSDLPVSLTVIELVLMLREDILLDAITKVFATSLDDGIACVLLKTTSVSVMTDPDLENIF